MSDNTATAAAPASPEPGGLAASLSANAGATPPAAATGATPPPADPGATPPAWTPPEFVPEAFRKGSAEETLAELAKGYTETEKRAEGLRTKLAGMEKTAPPKEASEYTFEPSEALKPFFPEGELTGKMLDAAKQAAHSVGIPSDKFGEFVENFHKPLIEAGLIPAPINPTQELANVGKVLGVEGQALSEQVTAIDQFTQSLANRIKLPDGTPPEVEANARFQIQMLAETGPGLLAAKALMDMMTQAGTVPAGGGAPGGAMTAEDLKTMSSDPRIDPANRDHRDASRRFDPALRKRYDENFMRLYGGNG